KIDRLLPKLNDVALTIYDVIDFSKQKLPKRRLYDFALTVFDRLNLLLHRGEEFEIAFLTEGLKNFDIFSTKENVSLVSGILNGFPTIKKRLYGGHKEVVLFKELRQLIGEARNLIETLHLTEVTLDLYSNELKSATKVSRLPYRHHPEYERFSTTRINSFKKEFKHVFSKYHYFLDHENLQTYQSRIRRTH